MGITDALVLFEKAIAIKLDYVLAWTNRGACGDEQAALIPLSKDI